jgi:hypothetical protein
MPAAEFDIEYLAAKTETLGLDAMIDKFEQPRLQTLRSVKQKAEQTMNNKPSFVYVTYIESTAEAVWDALTSADMTAAYWGHSNVSDWQVG